MRMTGAALLGLVLLGGMAGEALAAGKGADACQALVGFTDARLRLEVTAAERVPAAPPGTVRAQPYLPPVAVPLPAHCKVSGRINDRTGADGVRYGIGFELALPEGWNGRFLFQGGGGLNGSIAPALGTTAAGDAPALARGFAVVSTDSGHKGEGFDASFMRDQRAALDFAHASVGTTAQAALLLVERYYGKAPHHSYMAGCSTGGRETMLATQRYPELFDGVIAVAPAMDRWTGARWPRAWRCSPKAPRCWRNSWPRGPGCCATGSPMRTSDTRLCHASRTALAEALKVARAGQPLNLIGKAIEATARRFGFRVIENLGSHGVGRSLHEEPDHIPGYYDPTDARVLEEGMVITIEPFISTRTRVVEEAGDGWTLLGAPGNRSAQYEHTLVITRDAPIVLTLH